jgi:hypothetical protein
MNVLIALGLVVGVSPFVSKKNLYKVKVNYYLYKQKLLHLPLLDENLIEAIEGDAKHGGVRVYHKFNKGKLSYMKGHVIYIPVLRNMNDILKELNIKDPYIHLSDILPQDTKIVVDKLDKLDGSDKNIEPLLQELGADSMNSGIYDVIVCTEDLEFREKILNMNLNKITPIFYQRRL